MKRLNSLATAVCSISANIVRNTSSGAWSGALKRYCSYLSYLLLSATACRSLPFKGRRRSPGNADANPRVLISSSRRSTVAFLACPMP